MNKADVGDFYVHYFEFTGIYGIDWLYKCTLFNISFENISPIPRRHHCLQKTAQFRPMIGACVSWARRYLCCVTPAVTWGLVISGFIQRTTPFRHLLWQFWGPILTFILTRRCIKSTFEWMIDYLPFTSRSRIFYLYGDVIIAGEGLQNLGCRWRAAKFRPMLGAQGLLEGRDLYRATPAMTRDLGFSGLIRRTTPTSRPLRHVWGCGGPLLTRIFTGAKRIIVDIWSVVDISKCQVKDHSKTFCLSHARAFKWNLALRSKRIE
jgi:hypothetical protein